MNGYVNAEEMAERWNISMRQVQLLCQNGKINGSSKFGNAWTIPDKHQNQHVLENINPVVNQKNRS